MASTSIEWTSTVNPDGSVSHGKTWNPTVGCRRVSAGCQRCYAERLAHRLPAMGHSEYAGLTRKLSDGSINWTGVVRTLPERLELPLRWKKPVRIFVDSMSDLFHEDVPDRFIAQVWRTMILAPQHTFQILTKRPERMRDWVSGVFMSNSDNPQEPLRNVWLGTSVEDQRAADERIPLLLQTPAAVRFLSCEPLLGPIDIRNWLHYPPCLQHPGEIAADWVYLECDCRPFQRKRGDGISWVIAGGESGPNYRPMDLDWARSLRDQCQAAGVAFHFNQVGGRTHAAGGRLLDGREWSEFPEPAREAASASR
jgi:protein gp37